MKNGLQSTDYMLVHILQECQTDQNAKNKIMDTVPVAINILAKIILFYSTLISHCNGKFSGIAHILSLLCNRLTTSYFAS